MVVPSFVFSNVKLYYFIVIIIVVDARIVTLRIKKGKLVALYSHPIRLQLDHWVKERWI
jgi:hypothetical protein